MYSYIKTVIAIASYVSTLCPHPSSFSFIKCWFLFHRDRFISCHCSSFMTNRWAFLKTASTCHCSSWPVKYCGDTIWFEMSSLLYSKLCCYNRAFFETVICKMFATEDKIIGCIPPISSSPLHLLIPSCTQRRILWKAQQAYTISMGVRTTSGNAALDHIVD